MTPTFTKEARIVLTALSRADVSTTGVSVLCALHLAESQGDVATPKYLADCVGVPPPHISFCLRNLEGSKHIKRTWSEHDRRRVEVTLTPKGRVALGKMLGI